MKNIFKFLFISAVTVAAYSSCSDDELGESIFDITEKPLDRNSYTFALDSFAKREFLIPYNLKFIYRMEDIGSDMDKNLTPAPYDNSVKLAVLAKYLWYDVYKQTAGIEFLKNNSPRIIHVIGSKSYNPTQGTETLGVAEGGIKITLYGADDLDENDRLTPVYPGERPVVAYPFDCADPDRKRDHGQGVFQGADPVRFGDCHSAERDVACLRVGKDVPMQYECVSLKEAPNKCESGCGPKRLGHLGFACHSYIHLRGIIL